MTKEEVKVKSQEKVKAVETLCKQLQLVVSAEEVLTQQGFLKKIVYYTDTENYKMDEEKVEDNKPKEEKNEDAKSEDKVANATAETVEPKV